MSVTIQLGDISIVHRVARPAASSSSSTRPQPVVIKFTRRSVRNDVIHHRKELKGKNVFITEQLTPLRALVLKKANDLVSAGKLLSAWSQDGRVLIKARDNLIRQITSIRDLDQFLM